MIADFYVWCSNIFAYHYPSLTGLLRLYYMHRWWGRFCRYGLHVLFCQLLHLFGCYIAGDDYYTVIGNIVSTEIMLKILFFPVDNITFIPDHRPMIRMLIEGCRSNRLFYW